MEGFHLSDKEFKPSEVLEELFTLAFSFVGVSITLACEIIIYAYTCVLRLGNFAVKLIVNQSSVPEENQEFK